MGFFPSVFLARQTARTQPKAGETVGCMLQKVEENMRTRARQTSASEVNQPTCRFIISQFTYSSDGDQKRRLVERLRVNLASMSQANAPPPHLSNLCMKGTLLAGSYCSLSLRWNNINTIRCHEHQDNIRSGINRAAVNGQRESIMEQSTVVIVELLRVNHLIQLMVNRLVVCNFFFQMEDSLWF